MRSVVLALLVAAPLLFGVPVALGILISFIRLIGTSYPNLDWASAVNSDADQLYLGHTLYQDPAHGYTGLIYTPLFPTAVSLFDHIYLWNGWPLVIVILASVALIVLVARIAYDPKGPAPSAVRVLGAAGCGCIAYWCVSSISSSVLDEGRADQLAWAFAFFGLITVADFGPTPPRRRVVLAALLLSAAFWAKQTTLGVTALACSWVVGLAAIAMLDRARAALFLGVTVGLNLALLGGLNLLTDGWELYINFEMPTRHEFGSLYGQYLTVGLQSTALAIAFVAVTWLACALDAVRRWRERSAHLHASVLTARLRRLLAAGDPAGRRTLLLALHVPLGFVLSVYFMRKQGSGTNQFVGIAWGLGLFAACGWRAAHQRVDTAVLAGICVALCFALVQLSPVRQAAASAVIDIPAIEDAAQWPEVPPELRSLAADHTFYSPAFPELNIARGDPVYPDPVNFFDLLAAGSQPLYLVHALLARRFELIETIYEGEDPYTSAYGKWEENYLWKLNQVIAARYAPEPGLPSGVLGRTPGPEQDGWMRDCFGPFTFAGTSFRIHHGGGFWCSLSPDQLQLVATPVPLSEVVSTHPVFVSGTASVDLVDAATNRIALVLEDENRPVWTTRIATLAGNSHDLTVSTYIHGIQLGEVVVPAIGLPNRMLGLRLHVASAPGADEAPVSLGHGMVSLTTPAAKAALALVATPGALIDLSALRLTQ